MNEYVVAPYAGVIIGTKPRKPKIQEFAGSIPTSISQIIKESSNYQK